MVNIHPKVLSFFNDPISLPWLFPFKENKVRNLLITIKIQKKEKERKLKTTDYH